MVSLGERENDFATFATEHSFSANNFKGEREREREKDDGWMVSFARESEKEMEFPFYCARSPLL